MDKRHEFKVGRTPNRCNQFVAFENGWDGFICSLPASASVHQGVEGQQEQHCAHCDGVLISPGVGYVHADPNTDCIAFGGKQLAAQPPATSKSVDEVARDIAERIADFFTLEVYLEDDMKRGQLADRLTAIVQPYLADEQGVWDEAIALTQSDNGRFESEDTQRLVNRLVTQFQARREGFAAEQEKE